MVAIGRRSASDYSTHDKFDPVSEEIFAFDEITPERVCPPPHRSRMAAVLRGILFLLVIVGVGWVLVVDRASWSEWLTAAFNQSNGLIEQARAPSEPQAPSELNEAVTRFAKSSVPSFDQPSSEPVVPEKQALPETEQSPPSTDIAAEAPKEQKAPKEEEGPKEVESREIVTINATESEEDETEEVSETASLPRSAGERESSRPARLPPPRVDPDDPYQKRAISVGLHPGLSRVLLERMSPTDYRNAGIAIQRALGNPDNSATVIWPRQRSPEEALFRVRFVPGAPQGCRRYVVTITKDGWTTTAPPMESCGPRTASLPDR